MLNNNEKDYNTCNLCKILNQTVGANRKNAWTTVEDYTTIHLDKMKDCRITNTYVPSGNYQARGTV